MPDKSHQPGHSTSLSEWLATRGLYLVFKADRLIPETLSKDEESLRRARLQNRVGFIGAIFCLIYSAIYLFAGHHYGVTILVVGAIISAALPLVLSTSGSLRFVGNLYSLMYLVVFISLSLVGGGMDGHSLAWLAGAPLCAIIIADRNDAIGWSILSILAVCGFGLCHYLGVHIPTLYPERWQSLIDAMGYAGLAPFMFILGQVFESVRRRAFARLQSAMGNLSEANDKLSHLNREKSEFLNIAAHDLKNPLSVISGYADLMRQFNELDREEIEQYSGEILHSANRMLDIITNLLNVQAIEEGRMNLKAERCPFGLIIHQITQDYSQACQRKRIELIEDITSADIIAAADYKASYRIVENFVSNAIKYSPHGSRVIVTCRQENDRVILEVSDNGPGLSIADQKLLFNKFTRLTPQPTGGESSSGLGLWITARIAAAMDGKVYCRSAVGEGSTFGLSLPLAGPDTPERDDDFFRIFGPSAPVATASDGLALPA
jgi:signal transduction histidine kinase